MNDCYLHVHNIKISKAIKKFTMTNIRQVLARKQQMICKTKKTLYSHQVIHTDLGLQLLGHTCIASIV